ncbi:MAG: single-stranded DNA-binding protein [Syntrophomonadaceae bacterium]|nr:single-stranded DNA-binding protein [Syntrophomonadaceae bacterium]MDD3888669.1 single-stranded DNA-binding protein [Syntrophomonadaceae bacterium]MDD4548515.1 single-stranded DNA-binding protein [Syntrophomonadaceae bacterium]
MLNRVILIGRLTRDPELRYTPNGTAVAKFTLAINRKFNRDETDFIDIVTWRGLAENCANYLGKGRLAAVEGRLQIRNYETQEGQKRRATEVIADDVRFLDKAGGTGSSPGSAKQANSSKDDWNDLGREVSLEDIDIVDENGDDEIPF